MQIEESVYSLFGWEEKDNPDSKLENITQIFKSIYNGISLFKLMINFIFSECLPLTRQE